MTLEVIGAGFGRTGTSSLKVALEHLGYGPAHHMFEVRDNPAQVPQWAAAARGERVNWESILEGYRSQVDWPGARYWRELAAHYPEAKIILTVRDPDEWFDSVEATILRLLAARGQIDDPHLSALVDMVHSLVEIGEFGGRMTDRQHAISVFRARMAEVQATIAPSRLLTFDVRAGWEPLCSFLGREVPAISFPRLNSSRQFAERTWKDEIAPVD